MKISLETGSLKQGQIKSCIKSFSEEPRDQVLTRPDPNSHLAFLNTYRILLASCTSFSSVSVLPHGASEGKIGSQKGQTFSLE